NMVRVRRKNRQVLIFFLIFVMCTSLTTKIATAQDAGKNNEIKVMLNGARIEFDVNPYIKNSRTLVPFRKIFEAFGLEVQWNDTDKTVTASGNSTEILLKIKDTKAYVNSVGHDLDAPPEITNSRTFVPLRFIGESIGADVEWDDKTRTVNITYEAKEIVSPSDSTSVPTSIATPSPTPADDYIHAVAGKYIVGQMATFGKLKFSVDSIDFDANNAVVKVSGKINLDQQLEMNIYGDTGDIVFADSRISEEKDGDMYKFVAHNYFSSDMNVKKIDHIEIRMYTDNNESIRVAEYTPN
ncbi:MAG: copper amine oxidase N-terminal domain-containing protein, partial [Bacillota bacterium]|nr:copper amine oxidase N-terminal domain-containing protein [Bacillota bacterium]